MQPPIRITALSIAFLFFVALPAGLDAQTASTAPDVDLPVLRADRLRNGMRLAHLPHLEAPVAGYVDIAFGYVPADGAAEEYPPGVAELFGSYMELSVPARSVALAAHLAGGEFDFVNDPDRIGMSVRVPVGSLEDTFREIARYFSHAIINFDVLGHAAVAIAESADAMGPPGANEGIRVEVIDTMFERYPEFPGTEVPGLADVQGYFDAYIGTDRAYVISSDALPSGGIAFLDEVAFRSSSYEPSSMAPEAGEIEVRFPSRPVGGVIVATAIPSPRFESWFSALVIDRVLRRGAEPDTLFDFGINVGNSIHRIESIVRLPDYAEDMRDDWIGRIRNVMFESLPAAELNDVKAEVFEQLSERSMLEWFAAHDLWQVLTGGWNMLRDLDSDGLRSRAIVFAEARRVVALWSPAFAQPEVLVEELGGAPTDARAGAISEPDVRALPGNVPVPVLSFVPDDLPPVRLERLESGVTLAEADEHMIFVAGSFNASLSEGRILKSGPNGTLWGFPAEPAAAVLRQLDGVRANRLLVFYPQDGLPDARGRYGNWSGGAMDNSPDLAVGDVATADMPGLIVLKTWLEARVIEAGWWGRVDLRIDGIEGSRLIIEGDPEREAIVRSWIAELAADGIAEEEFERVRIASAGYFQRIRRELQIILWQRAPDGTIPPPATTTLDRLRGIAGSYFE